MCCGRPKRIQAAERSLLAVVGRDALNGATFVDVGCGSGLSSLAARRLGARVHSFDYDPEAVACTPACTPFLPEDDGWTIECGSALDADYLADLGEFDVVYAYGVLHHTGDMWRALRNVAPLTSHGGVLWIAIYNDQDRLSQRWMKLKRLYNQLPRHARSRHRRTGVSAAMGAYHLRDMLKGTPSELGEPTASARNDTLHRRPDWVGGYPWRNRRQLFSSTPSEVLSSSTCVQPAGDARNNEMLFRRNRNSSLAVLR